MNSIVKGILKHIETRKNPFYIKAAFASVINKMGFTHKSSEDFWLPPTRR